MQSFDTPRRCPTCGRVLPEAETPPSLTEEEQRAEAKRLRAALLTAPEEEKLTHALSLIKLLSLHFTETGGKEISDLGKRARLLSQAQARPLPEEYEAYFCRREAALAARPSADSVQRLKEVLAEDALATLLTKLPDLLGEDRQAINMRIDLIRRIEERLKLTPVLEEEDSSFEIDENGVLLHYEGSHRLVTIPEKVEKIGKDAFKGNECLEEIRLPYGVIYVDSGAFEGCTALCAVSLPESLSFLGSRAFFGCSSLAEITLPDSLKTIGEWCFSESGLASISLPPGVTQVQAYAFVNCKRLESATLSPNAYYLAAGLFSGCDRLSRVVIPEGIARIMMRALSECPSLQELTLPDSMTEIDIFALGMGDTSHLKTVSVAPDFSRVCRFTLMGNDNPSSPFDDTTKIIAR
ncbi:MAG: leucine-rich repeat protein [Clostridia bacterium]|nr:leucine-rich repeat protein [Clostridia bacterium]